MKTGYTIVMATWVLALNVHAGLNSPVLTNPGFEDPALTNGTNSNDINDWWDGVNYTFTQDDGTSVYPTTPYGDNWSDLGQERWMYQQIGTYEENMNLDVTFLLGSRTDKNPLTMYVSLLVGGNPALAADVNSRYYTDGNPLVDTVGATLIDTWTVDALSSSGISAETSAYVASGTGYTVGEPLWLQFHVADAGSGRVLIDNVDVALGAGTPPPFDATTAVDMYTHPGSYTSTQLTDMIDTILADGTLYGSSGWTAVWDILAPVITNNTPTPATPLATSNQPGSEQLACAMILWEAKSLLGIPVNSLFAHRAALSVGAGEPRVSRNRTINVTAEAHKTIMIDTGLYAAPGETVALTVPAELSGVGINVMVGHGVDANGLYDDNNAHYFTMPYPRRDFPINSTSLTVGNVHGGLIMFEVPDAVVGVTNAVVTIDGAVETPHFILGQTTDLDWNNGIRDRDTPWGVIETGRIKQIYDSRWLKNLSNPTDLLEWYQDTISFEEDFFGPTPTRPFRQHADYHGARGLSTFPQYKDPDTTRPLDLTHLQISGDGLMFHEYGHVLDGAMQWKWAGLSEAAPNMAGIAMALSTNWNFSYKDNITPIRRARNFDLKARDKTDFLTTGPYTDVNEKVSMLGMMIQFFGEQNVRDTIHAILAMPDTATDTDQKTFDLWLTQMGTRLGKDVSPLLESWHWPFSAGAKSLVSGLPQFSAIEQGMFNITVLEGSSVTFRSPVELGYSYDGTNTLDSIGTPSHGALVDQGDGTYTYTPAAAYTGSDSISYTLKNGLNNTFTDTIGITVVSATNFPTLEAGDVTVGTAGWTTVYLTHSYSSPVVVAQPVLDAGQVPLVTRIRNASGSSFEVRLQHADGLSGDLSGIRVEYLVVEEGVYHPDTHGIRMEAVKFTSTVTDHDASWVGVERDYAWRTGAEHYRNPSVFGQVMSYNDPSWSVFWSARSMEELEKSAVADTGFVAGKHVGEDSDTTRADETIGYVVIDAGLTPQYQIGAFRFQVGNVNDDFTSDYKLDHTAKTYVFDMMPSAENGIIQGSGLDDYTAGSEEGYWTALEGPNPFTGSTVKAKLVEDGFGSTTQQHQEEEGSYIVFAAPLGSIGVGGLSDPPAVNESFENPALAAGTLSNAIHDWWDAVDYTFTQDDGAATHPATPYGDNWADIARGRWMYQQIGTYKENMDLDISFLLGRRTDKDGLDTRVSLLVGGTPALATDANVKYVSNPLTGTVGATLITSSAVIAAIATAGTTDEHSLILSTGTGHTEGEPLWLQFDIADTGPGRVLIDNVQIEDVTDSDSDGMLDAWEIDYFTNGIAALPGGNADGDGSSNLEEYFSGMDPTNAASYFYIEGDVAVGTNGFVLQWPAVSNRLYTLKWTESLTNSFQTMSDNIEIPINSYTDLVHGAEAKGFYRVDVRFK